MLFLQILECGSKEKKMSEGVSSQLYKMECKVLSSNISQGGGSIVYYPTISQGGGSIGVETSQLGKEEFIKEADLAGFLTEWSVSWGERSEKFEMGFL